MNCGRCGRKAVYELKYSGQGLCDRHFTGLFERRVKKTIRDGGLLGDYSVAVAVSGGGNSMAALRIINGILCGNPKARLAACTVEGDGEAVEAARQYAGVLGVPHHAIKRGRGGPLDAVSSWAARRGYGTVASGENLDRVVRDSFVRLLSGKPGPVKPRRKTVLARVLGGCLSEEVDAYVRLNGIPHVPAEREAESMEHAVDRFLDALEENHPGIKYQMLRSQDGLDSIMGQWRGIG